MSKTKNIRKLPAKGLQKQTQTSIIRNLHLKLYTATSTEPSKKTSKSWTKNRKLASHFEGYIAATQEQEIPTKYLINKRARDTGKKPPCDNKCRLCKTNVEYVIHIISCCLFMSARYYLPMRHDMVAKTFYKEIIKKNHPETEVPNKINEQEYIQKVGDNEYGVI